MNRQGVKDFGKHLMGLAPKIFHHVQPTGQGNRITVRTRQHDTARRLAALPAAEDVAHRVLPVRRGGATSWRTRDWNLLGAERFAAISARYE